MIIKFNPQARPGAQLEVTVIPNFLNLQSTGHWQRTQAEDWSHHGTEAATKTSSKNPTHHDFQADSEFTSEPNNSN